MNVVTIIEYRGGIYEGSVENGKPHGVRKHIIFKGLNI